MSPVDIKEMPCRPVEFKSQWPPNYKPNAIVSHFKIANYLKTYHRRSVGNFFKGLYESRTLGNIALLDVGL